MWPFAILKISSVKSRYYRRRNKDTGEGREMRKMENQLLSSDKRKYLDKPWSPDCDDD